MTTHQRLQLVALFLVPVCAFTLTTLWVQDLYLPVSVGYLALLLVGRFSDLEAFVLLGPVRLLRDMHFLTSRKFRFGGAIVRNGVVETAPGVILGDQHINQAARFDFLVTEASRTVNSVREDILKALMINLCLIVFLVIITPEGIAEAASDRDSGAVLYAQIRLGVSYFAVVLQLIWFGQILLHYRQKNLDARTQAELRSNSGETHSRAA